MTKRGIPGPKTVSAVTSPHLAALVANGIVRRSDNSGYPPKPIEPRGAGKTAADYVSEGRR